MQVHTQVYIDYSLGWHVPHTTPNAPNAPNTLMFNRNLPKVEFLGLVGAMSASKCD